MRTAACRLRRWAPTRSCPVRFAIIGAAGFVAPRHMKAIRDNGHEIVAALDPHDSVGVLDTFAPGCQFFREPERFDRHLDKLRRRGEGVDYVSVCSPNYLHDAHCRLAMRNGADVICEKPLTLTPRNLDGLQSLEIETGRRVWTVLQMRLHPAVASMRKAAHERAASRRVGGEFASLTYVTPRGPWYGASWKGDEAKSGGIMANIGVHMFDLLLWIYGPVERARVDSYSSTRATGLLEHASGAVVSWGLAVDGAKPTRVLSDASGACDLSDGFKDAHTKVYAEILAGRGLGIADAAPAVGLVHMLRGKTP